MDRKSLPLILIVDDVNENLQVLATHLHRSNYEIALANSGKNALEMLTETKPDLILLDIMMPEMDGFDTCKRIKANPDLKDIPIIFLTAKSEEESVLNAFQLGAVDYLTKPVRITELLVRVETQINLKRSEDKLIEYNHKLTNLLKDRAEFMGIAAHDMKNPLNSIIAYSDLLLNDISKPEYDKILLAEKLKIIKNSAKFMLDSVTELLNHDVLEAGYRELDIAKNSPVKILETILINNLLWADSKNIDIKYIKYSDFHIMLDEEIIRDIFQNIISNALKYTNKDSEIWVSLSRTVQNYNHFIRFAVIDQGPGISNTDREKLFKKMQKLSARPTAGEGSTGMGLYIVNKLTELHGGLIYVNSKLGEGTEFIVDIPVEEFTELNNLKFYDDIDYKKDFITFNNHDDSKQKKWNYLVDLDLEINKINKKSAQKKAEQLTDFYYYIRKTNVINDIRKFASNIREFGEEINSTVFLEYGNELNKLAIIFDIEKLPPLLDLFPRLLRKAIKK